MQISKIKLPDDTVVELNDNRISSEYLQHLEDVEEVTAAALNDLEESKYEKPAAGIPLSDLNSDVQVGITGHGNAKVFFGTCDTAAGTGNKVVTCNTFTSGDLENGTMILVKFAETNTAAVADLSLNVNGTGAVPIRQIHNGTTSYLNVSGEIRFTTHTFVLGNQGTSIYWYMLGLDYNTNTTYSAMTQDNIDAGTGTTGMRISPKLLRDNFYTESEVDALLALPVLYVGDTGNNALTSEQKAHNLEVLAGNQDICLNKKVYLIDITDGDAVYGVTLNTVLPTGNTNEYYIDFTRFVGFSGSALYQSESVTSLNGDLTWSAMSSVDFLLSDKISTSVSDDSSSNDKVSSPKSVYDYVNTKLTSVLKYEGTIGSSGATVSSLPATHSVGDVYVVKTAGTYAGKACEVGDYIICNTAGTSANDAHWDVVNGENQVENKSASLATAGSSATIATIDGTDITVTTPSTWTGLAKTGTVTSVTIKGTSPIAVSSSSAITTSGTRTISHEDSGVTAGTYKSVTVDAKGHVTAGTNPTTLEEYGITDAIHQPEQSITTDNLFNYRQTDDGLLDFNGIANIDKLKGKTVVWNQLEYNGNFNLSTGWSINSTYYDAEISNNILSGTIKSTNAAVLGAINNSVTLPINHVLAYFVDIKLDSSVEADSKLTILNTSTKKSFEHNKWVRISGLITLSSNTNANRFVLNYNDNTFAVNDTLSFRNIHIHDLTYMFGSGNEPDIQTFEKLFPFSYYNYDTGSLKSITATGLETVGFNQWDEEWEVGTVGISNNMATKVASSTQIRTKNWLRVLPGQVYKCTCLKANYGGFYVVGASSLNDLGYGYSNNSQGLLLSRSGGETFTVPSWCYYILFSMAAAYGTTYNHDICINLSDDARNGQYEPYKKSIIDIPITTLTGKLNGTGDSVTIFPDGLKSVGGVYDEITSTKAIKRICALDLGTLTWTKGTQGGYVRFSSSTLADKPLAISSYVMNLLNTYGYVASTGPIGGNTVNLGISIYSTALYLRNDTYENSTGAEFKTAMSGVYIYYELETPKEYTLDIPLDLRYSFDYLGTEKKLPEDTASSVNAPLCADITYNESVLDTIGDLSEYIKKENAKIENGTIILGNDSITPLTSASASSDNNTASWGSEVVVGTVGGTDLKFTMPANPDNDVKVTQTKTTSGNTSTRPLLLGYSYSDAATFSPSTVTDTAYASHLAKFKPSTGVLSVVGLTKMNTNGTMATGSNTTVWNTNGSTASLDDYLPLAGGTMTGAIEVPKSATSGGEHTKGINIGDVGHIGGVDASASEGVGVYSTDKIWLRPKQTNIASGTVDTTKGVVISDTSLTYNGNDILTSTSVSSSNNTASWGSAVTVGTVGGTDLKFTMPSNPDTDTKNTAGSTDTSSKIFLIGATSQAANPQTYSDDEVYATSGVLTTKSVQVGGTSATMQYNSTDKSIEFVFS